MNSEWIFKTFEEAPFDIIDGIMDNKDELVENATIFHCCGGLMVEHSVLSSYIAGIDGGLDTVLGLSKNSLINLINQLFSKLDKN